jgi:hypothetical protein
LDRGANRGAGGGGAACPGKSPALRRPRRSSASRNGNRRLIGSQGCAHLGRRRTGGSEFREGAAGGVGGRRLGLQARAALRHLAGDGEGRQTSNSASRTSWRGLIAPEDSGNDEPATAAHWPTACGSVGAGDGGWGARRREQGLGHTAHDLLVL